MYLRTTKVKRPDGRVDEYIRLVESYWNDGSPRHRVVCNLGRKDLLAPHADALLHMLKGEPHVSTQAQEADALGAWDWRSEERRVGKSVDLGGRRIIKKKKKRT